MVAADIISVKEVKSAVPVTSDGRDILAKFFRAVGDRNRLALLGFLAHDEHSASECVAHIGLAQSRVSAHLACLVSCGLVSLRREGRFAYYSIRDQRVLDMVRLGAGIASDNAESVAACIRIQTSS